MKRNTLLVIAVVIAGLFIFFNPLQLFRGRRGEVSRLSADPKTLASLRDFVETAYRSPEDYIISAFGTHDIVFLGEFYKIRQNVRLVSSLLPRLHAAGVRSIGIEYALSDDQANIDALLTGQEWDEAKARAITFDWLVTWGYQEYIDIYKAAWQLNHRLPAGAKPFRVVGLNVRQNWEALKNEKDLTDPETVARILVHGVPDAHMAGVIGREFVDNGEKALVYCSIQHAFTRYRSADYEKNAAAMKLPETRRAGNIVYSRIGARAFTVYLHAPWPDRGSRNGLAFPVGGTIDALIEALPAQRRDAGFDTASTPLGKLPVMQGTYAAEGKAMTLADLCDGYVIQGPIYEYRAVTPIPDFVRPEDAERAAKNFPGAKPATLTVEQVNQSIAEEARNVEKTLAQFR